jgi:hypothetical protein
VPVAVLILDQVGGSDIARLAARLESIVEFGFEFS